MTAAQVPARSIPADWADLSAPWMTAVLAERFPGAEVGSVTRLWTSDGTNRRARFGLTYRSGAGPETVFVKAEGVHREVHARNGNLFNEPLIYASGLPLPLDHPACYVALLGQDPTLLHADAHVCNVYTLPGDDVGFLDWQVVRRGHWSQDAGYFLQGALAEADRRAADRELMTGYLAEFDSGGDADDAWLWYRASPAYGLSIWLSTLGTDGYQPHDVSRELVARYAAAFTELETTQALAALEAKAGH